eukprot:gene21955-28035_t
MGCYGLIELKRLQVSCNGLRCTVSVLAPSAEQLRSDYDAYKASLLSSSNDKRKLRSTPRRYLPNELIVSIVDESTTGGAAVKCSEDALFPLLNVIQNEPTASVEMKGDGFSQEEISLQPTFLSLSRQVLSGVSHFILPPTNSVIIERNSTTTKTKTKKEIKRSSDLQSSTIIHKRSKRVKSVADGGSRNLSIPRNAVSRNGRPLPSLVRIVGHSTGGAVAAYVGMILDGTLSLVGAEEDQFTTAWTSSASADEEKKEEEEMRRLSEADLSLCTGAFHDRVRCVTLGSPPCASRSVVPQYIRSIICGDDMVVRATQASLETFARRLCKALERGAGSNVPVGYVLGARWAGDIKSVAAKSIKRYTGSKHDISTLSLPGRVLFVKSRKMQSGATMQRVLRGNWQEDVLWQLHEILPSKRMLEHHSLENYIQTLNRC